MTIANPTRGPAIASDHDLWTRAAAGDRTAFGELFERHVEAVWNHAYRLTASWSQAEDLTSSTFLVAWRRRADIRLVRGSALPWLYTVNRNLAHDQRRGTTRFMRALRRVPDTPVQADHADDVAHRLDSDERMARILEVVRKLPRVGQEVVELCLLGELSTSDAAKVLGVAEGTVRSRLSRARSRLRDELKDLP